jgi:uncharacterized protein (TIGR03382 family)
VMTDDPRSQSLLITLSGNGIDRNLRLDPPFIDFGDRQAGVTTRFSDLQGGGLVTLANEDVIGFRVRDVHADTAFGASIAHDVDLGAGTSEQFDITFTPPHEGEYVGRVDLFFDDDELPQSSVEVRGRAVTVDVHGGGGCSASGGGGSLLLAWLLVAPLRRRRR